ncbi:tRNA pseudouridine synthase 1 [Yarrowia lipolytica]|jgi:tRNA pseudouridine38-40 synthase|uniref:tRNA pseudouridine synthase 1 n=1 Tax=Yarrowia lipolytica TaxID=4952 RepID=A0A371BXW9_YARLL|nr:tRNA pseudouridine synthase 1 [Yarrowia lipolytica]RDW32825.1 tRNA pseudouridine synthase 1 [Yarrowia lipolytica]RDW47895.1 tRNA pseudouridine synthase 1 [Yarrowia lipolytica]RDW54998.1 tRNA pseudouridine synthase 1 [Yarrowia lipolytica]
MKGNFLQVIKRLIPLKGRFFPVTMSEPTTTPVVGNSASGDSAEQHDLGQKRGKGGNWNRPRGDHQAKKQKMDRRGDRQREQEKQGEGRDTRRKTDGPLVADEVRQPKRKVACMIGYCGTGYHGMQLNPPQKTIEGDIFQAFVKAGAISQNNADDPKKSAFMRAARTDKGVHAAGNVISLKMIIEDENIVEKINSHLPEQLRVWGVSRTNKAFECRKLCSSRVYEYLMPTYSFLNPRPGTVMSEKLLKDGTSPDEEGKKYWESVAADLESQGVSYDEWMKRACIDEIKGEETKEGEAKEVAESEVKTDSKTDAATLEKIKAVERRHREEFRISGERLAKIREILKIYEGTHNFHNFTLGKAFKDPSAMRTMKSLTCSDPFLIDGTEWVSIKIHGQSFMLHQIRKMISMVALSVRCNADPQKLIPQTFEKARINIPKAPALGLLLERPVYDSYNKKLQGEFGREGVHFDNWNDQIEAFKHKFIYDKIYAEEKGQHVFHAFFSFVDVFTGDASFDFLLKQGITKECTTDYMNKKAKEEGKEIKKLEEDDDEVANEQNEG